MKTIVISAYYGCQGIFFKRLFENYKTLLSLPEKEEWRFIFSNNLQKTLKEVGPDILFVSFLYHPYRLIQEFSHFHFSLKDRSLENLHPRVREHIKKLENLSGRGFLLEEILFSKNRLKIIYNDLLLESNACFEIAEFFSEPEKACEDLASYIGLKSDLLIQAFHRVEAFAWKKSIFLKTKEEDLKISYLDFKEEISPFFLEKFLLAKTRILKREKVIPKNKNFIFENFQQEVFCGKSLSDEILIKKKTVQKKEVIRKRFFSNEAKYSDLVFSE